MEYEEMKKMLDTHCCARCEGPLSLIWDVTMDTYMLVCSNDRAHHGIKRIPSVSQAFARGEVDKHIAPGAQKDLEKFPAEGAPGISLLATKDIATGVDIARDKMLALIDWGTRLALKPYLGHVCLYFGKPYVTIDGYYYLLAKNQTGIKIGCRPLTAEEKDESIFTQPCIAYVAEAWEKGEKLPTTGLGIVTQEEIEGKSARRPEEFRAPVVHNHPQRMAEKRAEWQLLRKLIPLEEE